MKKVYRVFFLFFLFPILLSAQAGRGVYRFLDLPVSSRLSALGGSNVSLLDHDFNFSFCNPSLLSRQTDNVIGLNYASYVADVNFGSVVYGKAIGRNNFMAVGVQYLDYGRFLEKTETGANPAGGDMESYFGAKDIALYIAYARPLSERINIGATLKPIFSSYERYTSNGLALDLGLSYFNKEALFSAGFVLRNMGTQFKGYYLDEEGQHRESLPFDIRFGATKRLKNAPIRMSITLHNLQKWDLNYQENRNSQNTNNKEQENKRGFADTAFRHMILGFEFLPTEAFYLAVGYDHRKRRELSVDNFKSFSGLSFGAGIKIYKFQVGFSFSQLQKGVNTFQVSISSALNEFSL